MNAGNLLLSILTALCTAVTLSPPAHAAIITVTNTNDNGTGSLRQAITSANSTTTADTITFSIGNGWAHITPTSPLPAIYQPLTIDGTTQPGFTGAPLVEITGFNAGNTAGLWITGNGSGSTVRGLIINGFQGQGIFIDTNNVSVKGNYIGTNTDGSFAVANANDGIGIFSGTSAATANGNVIGGTTLADRNLISGNTHNGVVINAQNGGKTLNNIVSGNYIGTNIDGTAAIANGADGVLINDAGNGTATGNRIGGTANVTPDGPCSGECNLVSGNGYNGIGVWHAGAPNNIIKGNYVGVNAAGSWVIRNANIGVELNETPDNTVGGTTAAERNVLSGNGGAGVFITGAASTGNLVTGNYIGVNSTGSYSLNNLVGGVGIGYSTGIQPASNNIIGSSVNKTVGTCNGGCNVISGNATNGLLLSSSSSNLIAYNHIGVNTNNSGFVGNTGDGIGLINSPNNMIDNNVINGNYDNAVNLVGNSGGSRVTNNLIVANGGNGVLVPTTYNVAIQQNNIASNGKLGVDLGQNHITINDWNDGDAGANNQQNYPEVYSVHSKNGASYVSGTINSQPNTKYRLEFFQSDSCNAGKPGNYGEGQQFMGGIDSTTDQFGNVVYTFAPSSALQGNKYITATATRYVGPIPAETSEFSICRLVNTSRPAVTNGATWNLKDDLTSGSADKTFGYGFPSQLLMCAWDPNQKGVKLPVVFSGGTWYMRASYTTGTADNVASFGYASDTAVCGDWDGDGVETVGMYSPVNRLFYLRNVNTTGPADSMVTIANAPTGGVPVAGDWTASGKDGVGVVNTGNWFLKNTTLDGNADYIFSYGTGSLPVVGDWDGNGTTDIGAYYPGNGLWNVRTSLSSGPPTGSFSFGGAGYRPMTW